MTKRATRKIDPHISAVRREAGRRGAAARWGNPVANRSSHQRIEDPGPRNNPRANPSLAVVRTTRSRAQLREGRTDWYSISNVVGDEADLYIYDEIGFWGVTANDLVNDLRQLRASTLNVHINSPGGEVFDGTAIYNALVDHPATVNVTVEGLAASIASVIAMAGDKITMSRHTQMMIHDPHTFVQGSATDMQEAITRLELCAQGIADVYAARAGGTRDEWRTRMKATTWLTGEQAVELGLADAVVDVARGRQAEPEEDAAARARTWDLSIFATDPDDSEPSTRDDPEQDSEEGGESVPPLVLPAPLQPDTEPEDRFAALRAEVDPPGVRLAVLAQHRKAARS